MDITAILYASLLLLALGALFSALIGFLSTKLVVEGDGKLDEIESLLTGANCGACGYPGCKAFAEAVYQGKAKVTDCPSTSPNNKRRINELMGIKEDVGEKTYAIVYCNGGNACRDKYDYQGYGDCRTAEMLAGGRKACYTGCIGLGTCVDKCPYFAIEVNPIGYAEVKRPSCTSCGLCISNCPKSIIGRIPASAKVYCACSNHNKGREVRDVCPKGCIACGICAKVCPHGAITMVDNLPLFDYSKCTACMLCVEKCPTKVIKEIKD